MNEVVHEAITQLWTWDRKDRGIHFLKIARDSRGKFLCQRVANRSNECPAEEDINELNNGRKVKLAAKGHEFARGLVITFRGRSCRFATDTVNETSMRSGSLDTMQPGQLRANNCFRQRVWSFKR